MPLRFLLLIVSLGALVFLARLGQARIVTSHEARVAATAVAMADSGWPWSARPVTVGLRQMDSRPPQDLEVNPWLIPVFKGELRLQKPPLPYWCTAVLYRMLGPSELTSRLFPALLGILAAILVYDLARVLAGRRTARWTALVWVSTFFIVDEHRKAMADPYLAFFALSSFWAWVRAASPQPPGGNNARFAILFYLSLALGLLAKGPVLLLHILVPAALYTLLYRRYPRISWLNHASGVALLLLLALPWPIYVAMHVPGVVEMWRFESVGEFSDNVRNSRPWHFYLPALLQLSLPWTPVWAAGVFAAVKRPRRGLLLPTLWCAALVLVFSFAHMKKNAYLLPLMPAQSLIIGRVLAMADGWSRRRLRGRWPKMLLDTQAVIGMALGIGVAALVLIGPPDKTVTPRLFAQAVSRLTALNMGAAALALAAALIPLHRRIGRTMARRSAVQACCYAALIAVAVGIVDVEKQNRRKAVVEFTTLPDPALRAADSALQQKR